MGMAFLRSLLSSARLGRISLGSSRLLLLFLFLNLTSTSLSRSSNIIGPNVNGKVLQGITVDGALGRILLGEGQSVGVVLGEVVNCFFTDDRDVENAVEKVGGPESVELGVGDGVAEIADGVEVAADLERERADDCL